MDKMKDAILLAVAKKSPKGMEKKPEEMDEMDDEMPHDDHLMMISKDLIDAVHEKDVQAVSDLLKEAFDCLKDEY